MQLGSLLSSLSWRSSSPTTKTLANQYLWRRRKNTVITFFSIRNQIIFRRAQWYFGVVWARHRPMPKLWPLLHFRFDEAYFFAAEQSLFSVWNRALADMFREIKLFREKTSVANTILSVKETIGFWKSNGIINLFQLSSSSLDITKRNISWRLYINRLATCSKNTVKWLRPVYCTIREGTFNEGALTIHAKQKHGACKFW